jgi:hypothetical protein
VYLILLRSHSLRVGRVIDWGWAVPCPKNILHGIGRAAGNAEEVHFAAAV